MSNSGQRIWADSNRRLDLAYHLGTAALAAIVAAALYLAMPIIYGQQAAGADMQPQIRISKCAGSDVMAQTLKDKFGEVLVARGLQRRGLLLEVYATDDGLTWTIVASTPAGNSCILTSGQDWDLLPLPIEGSPA